MIKYVLRRLLWVFLSVIAFSFIAFVTLELPPGGFFLPPENRYIIYHGLTPEEIQASEERIADYTERFALDKPFVVRYAAWVRQVVVYGDWGQSMEWQRLVRDLIYERFWLTLLLTVSSLLLSWLIAIPLGMALARHRRTFFDILTTLVCRVARKIPSFLIALVVMWFAKSTYDREIGGLFSEAYVLVPWSWAKISDMLGHIWLPILILLVGSATHSTLAMRKSVLQVMDRSYLDVVRARGVSECRLQWRYMLRVALGQFFDMERWSLEHLVSSLVLVAAVLSLQTAGPMMLRALTSQDMFLSTAFVFLLGAFCIIGTALMDILRAALDPRVRAEL